MGRQHDNNITHFHTLGCNIRERVYVQGVVLVRTHGNFVTVCQLPRRQTNHGVTVAVDEDVSRHHTAMDDALGVQELEPLCDVDHQLHGMLGIPASTAP